MRNAGMFISPILSGLALSAALVNQGIAALGLAALVPLLWFLSSAKSRTSAFFGGWLYGTALWGVLAKWIFDLLPLDWAGLSSGSAIFFVAFSWSVTALALGLIYALIAVALVPLLKRGASTAVLGGTAVWVAAEFASSWMPTTVWMGSDMGPYPITLGHSGYVLAQFPALLGLASFGTIYLLSAAVFLANACFFVVLRGFAETPRTQTLRRFAPAIAVLFAIVAGTALDTPLFRGAGTSTAGQPLRVALVSSNIPSWSEVEHSTVPAITENLSRFLERLGREDVDLIVFPESARIANNITNAALAQWFENSDAVILDNALRRNNVSGESPFTSRLVAFRPRDGETVAGWDKSSLMMGGEYLPLVVSFWARVFGREDALRRFEQNAYRPGGGTEQPIRVGGQAIGVSICTQSWAPQFFLRQSRLGADVLVNLSSDALFHGSALYRAEQLAMLKVRAVENRSYLLHAANGNPSLVIDPHGAVREEVPLPAWLDYSYRIITLPYPTQTES